VSFDREQVRRQAELSSYDDGKSLEPSNPVIKRLISELFHHVVYAVYSFSRTDLMSHGTRIGIVTAAGYTEAEKYYGRLHGLLEAIKSSTILSAAQKNNIVIMGKCRISPHIFPRSFLNFKSNSIFTS